MISRWPEGCKRCGCSTPGEKRHAEETLGEKGGSYLYCKASSVNRTHKVHGVSKRELA